jgi:hypothetical protein
MNDLYGFMFAITNFLCPLIGAAMESSLGIRPTYDVMWIIDFSFCLILIIFNCGIHPLKDANDLKTKLKQYQKTDEDKVNEESHIRLSLIDSHKQEHTVSE